MSKQESIRVMCPNLTCRKILAVPSAARGKTVRCRGCGTNIKIPSEAPVEATIAKPQNPAA
jgi:hypothetical protein